MVQPSAPPGRAACGCRIRTDVSAHRGGEGRPLLEPTSGTTTTRRPEPDRSCDTTTCGGRRAATAGCPARPGAGRPSGTAVIFPAGRPGGAGRPSASGRSGGGTHQPRSWAGSQPLPARKPGRRGSLSPRTTRSQASDLRKRDREIWVLPAVFSTLRLCRSTACKLRDGPRWTDLRRTFRVSSRGKIGKHGGYDSPEAGI